MVDVENDRCTRTEPHVVGAGWPVPPEAYPTCRGWLAWPGDELDVSGRDVRSTAGDGVSVIAREAGPAVCSSYLAVALLAAMELDLGGVHTATGTTLLHRPMDLAIADSSKAGQVRR